MDLSDIDLSEWWAVLTNGEWFVGRRHVDAQADGSRKKKLTSVQKMSIQLTVEPTPKGPRPNLLALTYPWFGVDTLEIPEGALWIAVQAIHGPPWMQLIGSTEKLKLEVRAQRSGLHLA
jgi:hypothetical protein